MTGTVSFHAVDPAFFNETIGELVDGRRVNPEAWLDAALRLRRNAARSRRYSRALAEILSRLEPPEREARVAGKGWRRMRGAVLDELRRRVDRATYRPDELTLRVAERVEPELHLRGRPFFIGETSPEQVAEIVDDYRAATDPDDADALALEQLVRLDPGLARDVTPADEPELSSELSYRAELLAGLKWVYEVADAARNGTKWERDDGSRAPAAEVLGSELPWRATWLHSRAYPFWTATDVDGLETIRSAAGIEPAEFVVAPRGLFASASRAAPELAGSLDVELQNPRSTGAYVAPDDVAALLDFLADRGATIIREAARHGEGAACRVLLGKLRECATYAARRGFGYLEASGIEPPEQGSEQD